MTGVSGAGFPLLLVGYGKMGGALLAGWLKQGMRPENVTVIEPGEAAAAAARAEGARALADAADLPSGYRPEVVVLAVKPQAMDGALAPLVRLAGPETLFLSIAAGRTLADFAARLGAGTAVVRAMPNTPAAIGRGMQVACANAQVSEAMRTRAESLLAAVGEVAWVRDETLMDAVTAVSGSGPAYVFLLIEALARAGIAAGLPEDLSRRISLATVAGAGELARLSAAPPDELRRNVTSPGGTTEAALKVLMRPGGFEDLLREAVAAATIRSRQLAG